MKEHEFELLSILDYLTIILRFLNCGVNKHHQTIILSTKRVRDTLPPRRLNKSKSDKGEKTLRSLPRCKTNNRQAVVSLEIKPRGETDDFHHGVYYTPRMSHRIQAGESIRAYYRRINMRHLSLPSSPPAQEKIDELL